MFKREDRFSFKQALPKNTIASDSFSLRFGRNKEEGYKIAIVIGKKINNKAVVRNKLKRRFSNALMHLVKDSSFSFTMIFYLKKEMQEKKIEELELEIKNVLKKADII